MGRLNKRILILVLPFALALAGAGCDGGNSNVSRSAPTEAVEAIEVSILFAVQSTVWRYPISDRLQTLINKYQGRPGVVYAGTTFQNKGNGVIMTFTEDWKMVFGLDKVPDVKFRKGEVGVVAKEIYVQDGTEALVSEKSYVFTTSQWLALNTIDKPINPAASRQEQPQLAELKKLIADACVSQRPQFEGYNVSIDVQSVTIDPQNQRQYIVDAKVAFDNGLGGTRASLGYIDHFILSKDSNGGWTILIVAKK